MINPYAVKAEMDEVVPKLLEALQLDKSGDWDAAHRIVQNIDDRRAYWVHAYLHRKEGDLGNASYWYSRAGRSKPDVPLDEEWQTIYDEISGQPT